MVATTTKLTILQTVYPPISNAEATRLMRDPDVEALLRTSDFYMIGGRAQARMVDLGVDCEAGVITFNLMIGDKGPNPVRIVVRELPGVRAVGSKCLGIEFDEAGRGLRIWDGTPNNSESKVVEWFTTESLLWARARGRSGIYGLENMRELATYDLLYVGIATKGDSFDRLLARGHKARQEILANEAQRYPGARVADETFLFLFEAAPMIFKTFDDNHEFTDEDLGENYNAKRIVADAEKAFVSLLKPDYNIEKFTNYPKSRDGLYNFGYKRYGYIIGEQIAFNTMHGTIRGGRRPDGMVSNDADSIFIEGDTVSLYRSGIDFPAEDHHGG